eukprot:94160_1
MTTRPTCFSNDKMSKKPIKKRHVWICDICGRKFYNTHLQLNAHMKAHKKRQLKVNEQPVIINNLSFIKTENQSMYIKSEYNHKVDKMDIDEKPNISSEIDQFIQMNNKTIRCALDFKYKTDERCHPNQKQKTICIVSWLLHKIENGQPIQGNDIRNTFNLNELQTKHLWINLMSFVKQHALIDCINAFINSEMQRKDQCDISTLSQLFQCTPIHANHLIQDWLNANHT